MKFGRQAPCSDGLKSHVTSGERQDDHSLAIISNRGILKFWQNEAHRSPTLSLYRSLLRHVDCFLDPVAGRLRKDVRAGFGGSTGKGLRSIDKTRQALEKGYAAERLLRAAIGGDEVLLERISVKYTPQNREVVDTNSEIHSRSQSQKKALFKSSDDPQTGLRPRKPIRPPHLSFDMMKEPFLRPRFGGHNQSLSMKLLSRTLQQQKRTNLLAKLKYHLFLSSAEEEFDQSLGLNDSGWSDEIRLAIALLSVQSDETDLRRAQRWDKTESLHAKLWNEYDRDLERWKADMIAWRAKKANERQSIR